jgi:hypothetical protein
MLHSPLHATTCYLDPRLFGLERSNDVEVMSGLYTTIEWSTPDLEEAARHREQLWAYKLEEGIFGSSSLIHDRSIIPSGRDNFMDRRHLNCNILQFVF